MYDALVVGARCAGSPLAMLLARRGAKVLLLDRATFPSDIPHGHFVHRHAPRRLREWGILGQVAARTPAVTSAIADFGDFPLIMRDIVEDGLPWAYGPRRTTLDKILLEPRRPVARKCAKVSTSTSTSSTMAGWSACAAAGRTVTGWRNTPR